MFFLVCELNAYAKYCSPIILFSRLVCQWQIQIIEHGGGHSFFFNIILPSILEKSYSVPLVFKLNKRPVTVLTKQIKGHQKTKEKTYKIQQIQQHEHYEMTFQHVFVDK